MSFMKIEVSFKKIVITHMASKYFDDDRVLTVNTYNFL